MLTLNLGIDQFEAGHARFLSSLATGAEAAVRDYAVETLPDLVEAIGPKSEKEGQGSVTRDILKVVIPVVSGDVNPTPVRVLVGSRRWNGKVRNKLKTRFRVRRSDFLTYQRQKHEMVGFTAGAYAEAARELGVSLPSWMLDEHGDGSFETTHSKDHFRLTVRNEVPWSPYLPGVLAASGYAVHAKTGKLYDLSVAAMDRATRVM